MTPDQLQYLLEPLEGQAAQKVQSYAEEVMRGPRKALKYDQVERLLERQLSKCCWPSSKALMRQLSNRLVA